jgi:hypothetical protein
MISGAKLTTLQMLDGPVVLARRLAGRSSAGQNFGAFGYREKWM